MHRWLLLSLVLIVFGLWRCSAEREVERAPGVLVPELPVQAPLQDVPEIRHGEFRIRPLADFSLRARVLSRSDYRFDAGAGLAPVDLALGWGRMSDTAVIEHLDIRQSARFYSYSWGRDGPVIPQREIVHSSANMHLVPADAAVAGNLNRVRHGDIVRIEGQLIEALRDDGWRWRSSMTREDSGAGACELILVTSIHVEPA